jgi:hypothetical protein
MVSLLTCHCGWSRCDFCLRMSGLDMRSTLKQSHRAVGAPIELGLARAHVPTVLGCVYKPVAWLPSLLILIIHWWSSEKSQLKYHDCGSPFSQKASTITWCLRFCTSTRYQLPKRITWTKTWESFSWNFTQLKSQVITPNDWCLRRRCWEIEKTITHLMFAVRKTYCAEQKRFDWMGRLRLLELCWFDKEEKYDKMFLVSKIRCLHRNCKHSRACGLSSVLLSPKVRKQARCCCFLAGILLFYAKSGKSAASLLFFIPLHTLETKR